MILRHGRRLAIEQARQIVDGAGFAIAVIQQVQQQ